jgi:Ca2+-binding RTX toxin-like protein
MLAWFSRLIPWKRTRRLPTKRPTRTRARPHLEGLEDRTVPSTIVWNNRGTALFDSDNFGAVFGARADQARAVVDAAIQAWQDVIANFNYADGTNTFRLDVTLSVGDHTIGGSAFFASQYDANGKPMRGSILIGSGTDGHGAGYYLDATPNDSAEYRGNIVNAFAGDATSGGPAAGKVDFFTAVAHEMSHSLGLTADPQSAFQKDVNHYLAATGQTDQYFKAGKLWTFTGPDVRALMTSYNRFSPNGDFGVPLHTAEPVNSYVSPSGVVYGGSQDMNNAVYEYGRRYLVSLEDALILQDAYGYTITPPQSFGTFYANLDPATGSLLVRGGSTGVSADTITLQQAGGSWAVTVGVGNPVPGTGPTDPQTSYFPVAAVKSIAVQAGNGDDVIRVENTAAGVPVSIDAGDGDDTILLGSPMAGLNTILGPVNVVGGNGLDVLMVNDLSSASAGAAYTIRNSSLLRSGAGTLTYGGIERLVLNAGAGADTFNIETTASATPVTINAGAGNDIFRLGDATNRLDGLLGTLTLNADGGTNSLIVQDQGVPTARTYALTATTFTRNGIPAINYTSVQNFVINGGTNNDTLSLKSAPANATVTFNGGGGSDTLIGPDTTNTWRISAVIGGTLNRNVSFTGVKNLTGGAGADTFLFSNGMSLGGSIDGGGGINTLDYSDYRTGVVVNLTKGVATGVYAWVRNIQNVNGGAGDDSLTGGAGNSILRGNGGNNTLVGGAGDNILVGGRGNDKLVGGTGRNLLIGGGEADTLLAGPGGDLLIADATFFDASDPLLRAILAEWTRTDLTYDQRLDHLRNGTGLNVFNGTPVRLNTTTVPDDGATAVLTGGAGQDWFVAYLTAPVKDVITNLANNEKVF